ncbi:MAG: PAS domain S-box protein [Rhodospirillales bacterium]
MQHQIIDLILILLVLAALAGWIWYAYRYQVIEAKRRGYEEGQARFQAMVEDQTDLISRADADGKRLYVNEAYCRFFNRTRSELIGVKIGSFLAEEDRKKFHRLIDGLSSRSPTLEIEHPIVRHDGAQRWYHWTSTGIFDSDDKLVEIQGVGRDITERKQMEMALRESEERFRALAENSPMGVYLKDLEGRYLLVNEKFQAWYGTKDEIVGNTVYDMLPFDKADVFARQDIQVLKSGSTMEWELEQVLVDGQKQVTQITKFPVFGPDGNVIAIGGFNADITERKRSEGALEKSEKRLRMFSDAMPALFSYIDKDQRYRFCNLHYEKHFRRKRDQIIGMRVKELLGPNTYRQVKPVIDRVLSGETVFYEQWVDYREAGNTFVRGSLIPDIPPSGEIEGFFAMIQDMTARKYAEEKLAKAKEKAEETSASKSRFLAAASHDLRQPMQALAMFVDVLAGRRHDKGSREIIEKIQASSKSLEGLLNSLLDISKLEADLVIPALRRFTVSELTARLAEEIRPLAERKGLELVHVPSTLQIMSDPGLLDRVLRNLLTNAVKHTNAGRVLFGCRRRGGELRIEIWDTGPGIPDNQKDLIFEEFYQGGNYRDGLGLGLAIVDRLVNLLEHRVEVASKVGQGSVFGVRVPIVEAEEAPKAAVQSNISDNADGALIVGIDDDPAVRDALSLLLESWGFETVVAASEQDAVNQLSEANKAPDLVIADYRLQKGDKGSHAINAIRQRWGAGIPGLLLTGETDPKGMKEAAESGFQVVNKPILPEKLKARVAEQMKESRSRTGSRSGQRK